MPCLRHIGRLSPGASGIWLVALGAQQNEVRHELGFVLGFVGEGKT